MPGEENLEDLEKKLSDLEPEDLVGESGYDVEEWIGDDDWSEIEEEDVVVEPEVPQFLDNGDGTVSDSVNRLMWKQSDSCKEFGYGITWHEALDYCDSLNEKRFAGYDDWRLPGYDEAKTLFSFHKTNRDKDGAELHIDPLFEPGGGHNTWTHEEKPDFSQYAMKFSYVTGNDVWENKDNEYSHVRVVREERKEEWEPEWRKQTKKFDG
ncbi:MAG: DUF1566 domain-containing protein [Nitrospinae bacterium]|nr:DUF1566 domain-containing protein [Nitrospinota bacterium]